MQKKAFVLLSGGLDSTTALALANEQFSGNVEAVSIDYGQRHIKETEQAKLICDHYGFKQTILSLRGLMEGDGVMLTNADIEVPNMSYDEIKGVSPTYVPFRNGTMLSAITAHAQKYVMAQIEEAYQETMSESMSKDDPWYQSYYKQQATAEAKDLVGIYFGAHAEDALNWAYPDCTPEFIGSMANAIYVGSYFSIRLFAPFVSSTKGDIVRIGTGLGVPYELTWSCYKGGALHCGTCPTCRSRKAAFEAVDVTDPTVYEDEQPGYGLSPAETPSKAPELASGEIPF